MKLRGSHAVAAALVLAGCFDQHREPRTFVVDGSTLAGDAFAGGSPSTCFPRGADTVVIGPGPGCVEASVEGEPFEDGLPATGRPIRFADATEGALAVTLEVQVRCAPRREGGWEITWLIDACDSGPLNGGACVEEWSSVVPIAFDEMSAEGVLEALVAGDRAVAHFTACAAPR